MRVRQSLNVESGLNDGIAVPFYLLALELARAEVADTPVLHFLGLAAQQIGLGIVAGIIGGVIGGLVIRRMVQGQQRREPVATARHVRGRCASRTASASGLGGSVFIATFTGGVAFAAVSGQTSLDLAHFSEQAGAVLSALTFAVFGLAGVAFVVTELSWTVVAYAVLSLTVVRMVPVAISLLGSGTRPPTVAFIGWFGPRGLASIVFGLGLIGVGLPNESACAHRHLHDRALQRVRARVERAGADARCTRGGTQRSRASPKPRHATCTRTVCGSERGSSRAVARACRPRRGAPCLLR